MKIQPIKDTEKKKRFKSLCLGAVIVAILFLIILLSSLAYKGLSGFTKTTIQIPIYFNEEIIDPENTRDIAVINKASFRKIFKQSLLQKFPEAKDNRKMYRNISKIFSRGSTYLLKNMVLDDISLIGKTINVDLISSSTIDQLRKNNINIKVPESDRPVSDATLKIYDQLNTEGVIKKRLNFSFFKYGDSRNPEEAGILGALLDQCLHLLLLYYYHFL